ncbi:MAG TPA: hypothetical protein ENI05_14085 [Porticoccus sp.]|nr:hypothetical protein [Porticoccus sp.]
MNKIKVGHYEADDGIVNLPLGFIPDVIDMDEVGTTNPDHIRWYRAQETDEASGSQEGMITNGADGVITKLGDAAGITAYDTGTQAPTINEWTTARATAATARTATAAGTYIKPTVSSPTDRGAIFECVTAGTGGGTEPTWPDAVDENVTDNSVVWKRVDRSRERIGYQGIVIAAALNTNGQEWYYEAKQANQSIDHGDVDGWTDGIDPDAN